MKFNNDWIKFPYTKLEYLPYSQLIEEWEKVISNEYSSVKYILMRDQIFSTDKKVIDEFGTVCELLSYIDENYFTTRIFVWAESLTDSFKIAEFDENKEMVFGNEIFFALWKIRKRSNINYIRYEAIKHFLELNRSSEGLKFLENYGKENFIEMMQGRIPEFMLLNKYKNKEISFLFLEKEDAEKAIIANENNIDCAFIVFNLQEFRPVNVKIRKKVELI